MIIRVLKSFKLEIIDSRRIISRQSIGKLLRFFKRINFLVESSRKQSIWIWHLVIFYGIITQYSPSSMQETL